MAELTADQKKKRKLIIIIVVILIILAIAIPVTVILVKRAKEKKKLKKEAEKVLQATPPGVDTANKGGATPGTGDFPLQEGSKGEKVLALQKAVNVIRKAGQAKLTEDGSFGAKTKQAVIFNVGEKYYPVSNPDYMEILGKATEILKKGASVKPFGPFGPLV